MKISPSQKLCNVSFILYSPRLEISMDSWNFLCLGRFLLRNIRTGQEMQDRDPKRLRKIYIVSQQEAIIPSKQADQHNDWLDSCDKI